MARNEIKRILSQRHSGISLQALLTRLDQDSVEELLCLEARSKSEFWRREEECELVHAALAELSDRDRALLKGKYFDGKSLRELAKQGHLSVEAVASQLRRAREKLRALLGHLESEP